jgi:hypothetical protein
MNSRVRRNLPHLSATEQAFRIEPAYVVASTHPLLGYYKALSLCSLSRSGRIYHNTEQQHSDSGRNLHMKTGSSRR